MPQHWYFSKLHVVDAPAELPSSAPIGMIYETLEPLALYAYTEVGWDVLAATSASTPPDPASEAGAGIVELATEAEVQAGTAGLLVVTAASLKAELDRRGGEAATETALGPVELASETEVQAGNAELGRAAFVAAEQRGLGDVMAAFFDKVDPEARGLYGEWTEIPPPEMLTRQRESVETLLPGPTLDELMPWAAAMR